MSETYHRTYYGDSGVFFGFTRDISVCPTKWFSNYDDAYSAAVANHPPNAGALYIVKKTVNYVPCGWYQNTNKSGGRK